MVGKGGRKKKYQRDDFFAHHSSQESGKWWKVIRSSAEKVRERIRFFVLRVEKFPPHFCTIFDPSNEDGRASTFGFEDRRFKVGVIRSSAPKIEDGGGSSEKKWVL